MQLQNRGFIDEKIATGEFACEAQVVDEALRRWQEEERRRLHRALGERLNARPMTEEEFAEMLARAGKLTRPDRGKATPTDQRAKPMTVTGEPLSKTVIKDRR